MYYISERLSTIKANVFVKITMILEDWKVGIMSKLLFVKLFFFCHIYVYSKENLFKSFKSI